MQKMIPYFSESDKGEQEENVLASCSTDGSIKFWDTRYDMQTDIFSGGVSSVILASQQFSEIQEGQEYIGI